MVKVDSPLPLGTTEIYNSVGLNGDPPECPPGPWCVITPTPPYVVMEKALTSESGSVPDVAEPGETLTYQITLTNYGGSDQNGYNVTDQLDPFTTFASTDNGGVHSGGSPAGGDVKWTNLSVAKGGGTLVLTVVVTVDDPIPHGITHVANLVYETGTPAPPCDDPVDANNPKCVITPTAPSLAVAKALTDESIIKDSIAELGEELTYTITVRNWGGTDALNTIINETVPQHTTFVSGTPGWTCSAGAPAGTACSAMVDVPAATGSGQPGMKTLTFKVKVDDSLPPGVTQIVNAVGYNDVPPPECEVTNPACVVTPTVNLNMVKSVVSVSDTGGGTYTVQYQIAISNTGGAPGSYTLFDTPDFTPTGVSYNGAAHVSTTGGTVNPALSGGNYNAANGMQTQLSALNVTIGSGQTHYYVLDIPVGVTGNLSDGSCSGEPANGYYNAADLTGTYDLHSAACAPVSGTQALLSLVKETDLKVDNNGNGYGNVGDVVGYTFTITNSGTEPLSTLQLFDTKAKNLHCASLTSNGFPLHVSFADTMFYDGFDGGSGILLPSDGIVCHGEYVLTQTDVDRRVVSNAATVQAAGPAGSAVSATGTAQFTLFQ